MSGFREFFSDDTWKAPCPSLDEPEPRVSRERGIGYRLLPTQVTKSASPASRQIIISKTRPTKFWRRISDAQERRIVLNVEEIRPEPLINPSSSNESVDNSSEFLFHPTKSLTLTTTTTAAEDDDSGHPDEGRVHRDRVHRDIEIPPTLPPPTILASEEFSEREFRPALAYLTGLDSCSGEDSCTSVQDGAEDSDDRFGNRFAESAGTNGVKEFESNGRNDAQSAPRRSVPGEKVGALVEFYESGCSVTPGRDEPGVDKDEPAVSEAAPSAD